MKKMRFLSVMLCLALLASLLAAPALADDSTGSSAEGLIINKTAVYNAETDDYTITLEAYATGSKIISTEKKDVPTDIVLVLDQSGSMNDSMKTTTHDAYGKEYSHSAQNQNLYKYRHSDDNTSNQNLWYKLDEKKYVTVSVQTSADYSPVGTVNNNYYYTNKNNLYIQTSDEEYKKLSVNDLSGTKKQIQFLLDGTLVATLSFETNYIYKYKIAFESGYSSDMLYVADKKYSYYYKLPDDESATLICESVGDSSVPTETFYYKNENGTEVKLTALKNAVSTFVNSVNEKAKGADGVYGTEDDVNHRIAVVTFSSKNEAQDKTGLLGMNTADGYSNVTNAINQLSAGGDTYPGEGLSIANNLFTNNPVEKDEAGKDARQRVVVLFTDGYPAPSGTNNIKYDLCNAAIDVAYTSKTTYKATVYTIGIFDAANPGASITDGFKQNDSGLNSSEQIVAANRYMHYTSSNYLEAKSLTNGGTLNKDANPFNGGDSYYLAAADADTLNNIFQKISNNISTGGSSSTLGAETVIKDIIAPQFELPEGTTVANITLETYACTGKNGDEYIWTKNDTAMGATATIDDDKVDVTGFDFSKNWCGTETTNGDVTYCGNKLVISFKVKAKDAFLGGNDVFTNTSAGVYENAAATEPVLTFNRPQVNVPIKAVTVTAKDKNVYLLGSLTAEQIKAGATVTCENVSLNLGADNYGLESWQNEYVNIEVTYTDASGNAVTDLSQLKADTTYTVTATVKPKTDGSQVGENGGAPNSMEGKTDSKTKSINVFKPELTVTFKDNTVDYMSAIDSTNYVSNGTKTDYTTSDKVSETEVWKHGETDSTDVTMIGEKPTLTKTYTYSVSEGVTDGKVTSITYVPVKAEVAVKIGETPITAETTFLHLCDVTFKEGSTCQWDDSAMKDGNPAFLLHVENVCADLTIKKEANDVAADPGQSFLFTITGPNNYTNEVIIVGSNSVTIKDLQIGEYTVTEDTSWSWRYTPDEESESITLDSDSDKNVVTFTNTRTNENWLDGNTSVDNVFGDSSITQTYNNPAAATN